MKLTERLFEDPKDLVKGAVIFGVGATVINANYYLASTPLENLETGIIYGGAFIVGRVGARGIMYVVERSIRNSRIRKRTDS